MKKAQCVLLEGKLNKREGRKFASMECGEVYVVMDGVNLMGSCSVKTWGILNREQVSHCYVDKLEIYITFLIILYVGKILFMDAIIWIP